MHRLRSFVIRIWNSFRRSRLESDLAEQLDAHRELIKADLMARGVGIAEAELAARRAVGNDTVVRDFSHDEMVHRWIDNGLRDIRYALRTLFKSPAFAAAVILTLAMGIGANTAIFTIVDQLLLRPLPFPNGNQLVVLKEIRKSGAMDVSPANWLDWQRDARTFESLAAWSDRYPSTLTGQGEPERLKTETVSHEFFSILGVRPQLGRVFMPEDEAQGAPPTAVLSHSLWQRRLGGDPNVIGRIVELNGRGIQVVGVMPAGFHFLSRETEVWQTFGLDRNRAWREMAGRFLPLVVGRIKPSVTQSAARQEIESIAGRLAQLYSFNKDTSASLTPLREVMTGEVRASVLFLFAAVGLLLFIACSNVANLMIARSANRRRELAIRTSLGAGRGAIVRQLVIESLMLASLGGVAGVFIARWGVGLLVALAPSNLGEVSAVGVDQSMLLYTMALSIATGVLVGLAPAAHAMRFAIADQLRNGGRSVTASMRLRQGLIVAQVALTIVLLCGAGLLVRSLLALNSDPVGVDARDVLSLRVDLPFSRYNPSQQVAFFRQAIERLQMLPGVQSASAASDIPVSTAHLSATGFRVLGQPEVRASDLPSTNVRVVAPGYFKVLGIPLLKGRDFTDDDLIAEAPQVFVVNEAFAKKFFPVDDALSASISVFMQRPRNPFGRIVGVVGDVKEGTLRGAPQPTVFYNYRQLFFPGMSLFIRSQRARQLAPEATQIIRDIDRNLPVVEVRMVEDAFAESLTRERLNAIVSGAFAVCALLLASLGLYGLLAFVVTERRNEIGIRMALGAQASQVVRMIVKQGLRLILVGASLGLVTAFAASRYLESLLFGVTTHDPMTFAAVPALLLLVSLIAVIIPARRATRVNPIQALRED